MLTALKSHPWILRQMQSLENIRKRNVIQHITKKHYVMIAIVFWAISLSLLQGWYYAAVLAGKAL